VPMAADQDQIRPVRRVGGLLRQRNFRLLWAGETVSETGNSMAVVGVPLLAIAVLHASTFAVSALTAAAYLPWLVIGLPAGAWADRLPPRPLMVGCDIVSALLYASLPVAAWLGILTIGQVLVVALLAGAANVFFATAYQVYLPALVTADELMEGNAKLQGSMSVATIGGSSAAGLAARAVGDATALLFNAGSFLVSAACLLSIRAAAPPRRPAERTTTIRAEISEGARFIGRDALLRPLTSYAALANLAYSGSTALVVVFLVRVAGFGPAAVGLLMATSGVGGIAGAMVARRVAARLGTARGLLLTTLGGGLFGLLIPLTGPGPRAAFYVVGAAVVGAGITSGNIIVASFRQTYTPPHMLGRITASQRFLVFGTIPLGALIAGGLGTALGVRSALWIILTIYALSGTLLLTRAFRADKNLPTSSAPAAVTRPGP
jgi:predicted MFS family arabinose efflux permease